MPSKIHVSLPAPCPPPTPASLRLRAFSGLTLEVTRPSPMARPRLAPDPPGWSFPLSPAGPPESPRCTPSQAGQREAPLGRPVSQHGEGRDRTEGLSAAAACVGTNFLAPPPSWRQQLRPDKEEGRGRPGSSFSLAVPHFEADSGNLAPPSPGEDGPPVGGHPGPRRLRTSRMGMGWGQASEGYPFTK